MTQFRFIPLAVALAAVGALTACNTAPAMRMGGTSTPSMATPDAMARMDVQMKTMQGMHEKMMNAKTPEERSKLMADHMKSMQDGMTMMGDMKAMGGDMSARQQMMEKRMEMMQTMMKMMMDRLPAASAK